MKYVNIEKIFVICLFIYFWIDFGFIEVEVCEFDLNFFIGIGVKIISVCDVCWVRVGIFWVIYCIFGGGSLSDIFVVFGWNKKNWIIILI